MAKDGDFASLMESAGASAQVRVAKRLRVGSVVEGAIVQIGKDSVFVDVGTTVEGRIDRGEFEDKSGKLSVQVGDAIRATVLSNHDVDGPVLSVALGRSQSKGGVDVSMLENARESGMPVTGTVQKAVKGGLEVQVGGVRAFCPASQVDTAYIADLTEFVGQSLTFAVIEVKDAGRSVVLSRKALLETERKRDAERVLSTLKVGNDYEGVVKTVQKYGAFVDLGGGVEGLIHVSELAHSRVDRVEDVLSVGEKVTVRLLALEPAEKGPHPKLRLSLKARQEAPASPQLEVGEVLTGTVSKLTSFGVFVDTPKGNGLVPSRELGIPRGADYRKLFPVGKEVKVVLVASDGGKITFSIGRVAGVEERQNYRDFSAKESGAASAGMGSLGLALQKKLGLTPPRDEPVPVAPASPTAPVPAPQPEAPLLQSQETAPVQAPVHGDAPPAGMFRRKH